MCFPAAIADEQTKLHGEKWKNFDNSRLFTQTLKSNFESQADRPGQVEDAVQISAFYNGEIHNLIREMMNPAPEKRPSFENILKR